MSTKLISLVGNIFVFLSLLLLAGKYPILSLVFSLLANAMFIWYGSKTKHHNFIYFSIVFAVISICGIFNWSN